MNKDQFLQTIEKYHLNKLIEKACWTVKDKQLNINFVSPNKDLVGFLSSPTELEDAEIGIFDTGQLLSLVNITDDNISLGFETQNNIPIKLTIEDNTFSLYYTLSDINLIEKISSVNTPQEAFSSIEISSDFVSKFLKAKKALNDIETLSIELTTNANDEKIARFIIGENSNYSNKIVFDTYCDYLIGLEPLYFNANIFKDILAINKNSKNTLYLYQEGMIKFESEENSIKTTYYLVALSK